MLDTTRPDPIRSPALDMLAPHGIRHGFFTRAGGVSAGLYAGLNVGVGSADERASVIENRARVAAWLGVASGHLVTAYQVHSPDVLVVDGPIEGERPKVDALVTARPGLALGVLTADCGPILFADGEAGVIAAAHAGWKGALTGIVENTLGAMEGLGARRERIVAVLGPSISAASYEVGPEFVERLLAEDGGNGAYLTPSARPAHAMFDLPRYTLDRLARAGVEAHAAGGCTYAQEDLFYSYRRATHRNEPDYGRQISAIVMETR